MHKRILKTLLHDVLSVLSVTGYAERYGQDSRFVTLDEDFKSQIFAVLGGNDQIPVRFFRQRSAC
jgi:hypothetical protein